MAGCRLCGHDVDELGRADDDGANAVRRRLRDLGTRKRELTQLGLADRRRHVEPVAHLALDLHDARHRAER